MSSTTQTRGSQMFSAEIHRFFRQASGGWTGCDWPMQFGKLGLNLCGLKSSHAALMARATSGEESCEWRRAAKWLAQVEQDARQAEAAAQAALGFADEHPAEALRCAEDACRLESQYHEHLVWQPLRDALARRWQVSG